MDATTPLVDDVEEAAQVLLGNVVLRPGGIPRVANMLTEKARTMRGERRKPALAGRRNGRPGGKARTIKVWVGKKRSKGNEIRVPKDWTKGEW